MRLLFQKPTRKKKFCQKMKLFHLQLSIYFHNKIWQKSQKIYNWNFPLNTSIFQRWMLDWSWMDWTGESMIRKHLDLSKYNVSKSKILEWQSSSVVWKMVLRQLIMLKCWEFKADHMHKEWHFGLDYSWPLLIASRTSMCNLTSFASLPRSASVQLTRDFVQ